MIKISVPKFWVERESAIKYRLISIDVLRKTYRLVPLDKSHSVIDVSSDMLHRCFEVVLDTDFKNTFPLEVNIKHNIITAIEYLLEYRKSDYDDKVKINCLNKAKQYINNELKEMSE